MIHQIADENGTLKHIILSVMNAEDNSQLDSTVITLPQGTFRIDSHGELVSTGAGDGPSLTTLPQQAYFANYDGCPVSYDATALTDSIATTAPTVGPPTVNTSYSSHPQAATSVDAITSDNSADFQGKRFARSNSLSTGTKQPTNQANDSDPSNSVASENQALEIRATLTDSSHANPASELMSDKLDKEQFAVGSEQGVSEAEQMVVATSMSDTSYPTHQVVGEDIDMASGSTATPIVAGAENQIYGYPACCCCCYCDPQEAINSGQSVAATCQQDGIVPSEHANNGNRASNRQPANGVMAYPGQIISPQLPPNISLPISVPPTGPILGTSPMPGVVCQNGFPIQGGFSHMTDCGKTHIGHTNKGSRTGSNSGYKQHKSATGSGFNGQLNDRQQAYSGHHSHPSYNNIVSGQHHYHQSNDMNSQGSFKSQTLLSNKGAVMAPNYSHGYQNYSPATATVATAIASNKPIHQQQPMSYRTPEGESYGKQRGRDQLSYSQSINSYGPSSTRSQHNENKRQALGDKNASHHNNRFASAPMKSMIGNHLTNNSTAIQSQVGTSVSPLRSRMKGTSAPQHHQPNGARGSGHYGNNQIGPVHESKDNSSVSTSQTVNTNLSSRDSSHNKAKNIYAHDHAVQFPKHISNTHVTTTTGYYHQSTGNHKSAWQGSGNNKFKIISSGSDLIETNSNPRANIESPKAKTLNQTHDAPMPLEAHGELKSTHRQQHSNMVDNCDSKVNESDMDSRSSRGKQKKCQNLASKGQFSPNDNRQDKQQLDSADRASERGGPTREVATASQSIENNDKISLASHDKADIATVRPDSKSRQKRELSLKQSKVSQKRTNRDKQAALVSKSTQSIASSKTTIGKVSNFDENEGGDLPKIEDGENGEKEKCEKTVSDGPPPVANVEASCDTGEISPAKSTSRRHSNDGSSVNLDQLDVACEQAPRHKSKRVGGQPSSYSLDSHQSKSSSPVNASKVESPRMTNLKSTDSVKNLGTNESSTALDSEESLASKLLETDDVLVLTSVDSPALTAANARSPVVISMRTSLSETNIQALDTSNSSVKSTQTTPQKVAAVAGTVNGGNAKQVISATDTTRTKKGDKRRGSSVKNEKQVKLSSMPQLRLLNLNCTSVTSSSVQLRWSYIPSLAEKYGIHHHPTSRNPLLMDHFVVELSSTKNVGTNTLTLPKIVYQGCALTCRVGHLSPEKIYHFKVRRTALVTAGKDGVTPTESTDEHVVVSEILSVTLPSVSQSNSGQQASKKGSINNRANQQRSQDDGLQAQEEAAALLSTAGMSSSQNASRGNTSSHSNSNCNKTLSQPIKLSNLFKLFRTKVLSMLGRLVQNSLSSYSDTKFAGLLLVLFTVFAMLLALFIHLYIVAPVTE